MSIEIYDNAKVVKKDNKYYYLVKYGSKNCFTCPGQYVMDNQFNNKYLRRQNRDSHWSVVAIGNEEEHKQHKISNTYWNSPTSTVYGRIQFSNRTNIALALVKSRVIDFYSLTESQQNNLIGVLREGETSDWTIKLEDIPEHKRFKAVHSYCDDKNITLDMGQVEYAGKIYWNLNNL